MIISPPFLPARATNRSDEAWMRDAMPPAAARLPDTRAAEGSFPLSHQLAWHNGVHIQAPPQGNGSSPARAVADGTVRFVHPPTARSTDIAHPQNYNPFDLSGASPAWTDDGCIVIEHRTAIGFGQQATEITFFSTYVHLSTIARVTPEGGGAARPLVVGDSVRRKDVVGSPGEVYGHAGQIHFEISLDPGNLQSLLGRAPVWVDRSAAHPPTANGRVDAVFGSVFVYLPATTPTAATRPDQSLRRGGGATLGVSMWVRITYEHGACVLDSLDRLGATLGTRRDPHGEADLYSSAERSHNALPPAERAHSSVSGWYEIYRFGRVIDSGSNDPVPANAAHWRQIVGPNGVTWADLNCAGSFKFSDADFPSIAGWNVFDDDTNPADQRCDSARLRALVLDSQTPLQDTTPEATVRRLGDPAVQTRLRRALCRFPNEWAREDIEARYGFVHRLDPFSQSATAWPRFLAHLQALSYPGLPAAYRGAVWHVHPAEFITHMRKCGWLSSAEAIQTLPRSFVAEDNRSRTMYRPSISLRQASARIEPMLVDLNRVLRKYLIDTRQRQACFLANAMVESGHFSQFFEGGRGAGHRYGDWYGRGIIQLTWEAGYLAYFAYRGRDTSNTAHNIRWRDEVETNAWDRCDSAGFWWVRNAANATADPETDNRDWVVAVCENFNWRSHRCDGALTRETRLENPTLERVGRHVNTGSPTTTRRFNGLPERQDTFIHVQAVLMEVLYPDASGSVVEVRPRFFRAQR